MYPGKQSQLIFLLFVLLNCNNCTITFWPNEQPIDYSFPITGEVLETNNVSSVIERRLLSWVKKPLPEANILITGVIGSGIPFLTIKTFSPLPTVKLKYQDDDTYWFLPHYWQRFRWSGTIKIDEHSENTTIEFTAYGNNDGYDKHFILTGASLGQTILECDDPVEIYKGWEGEFPFLVGYAHLYNTKCRIYAVFDDSPGTMMIEKEVFFSQSQRFQFLDERDIVIAELKNGRYTIYDTVPETETATLKQAIALLVAYRHAASVLRDIKNEWDLPLFHRYVCQ